MDNHHSTTTTTPRLDALPQTMTSRQLNAAIALNNMAITMMERDCYQQAHETFQAVACLAKIQSMSGSGSGSGEPGARLQHQAAQRQSGDAVDTTKQAVLDASQKLLHPKPSATIQSRMKGKQQIYVSAVSQNEAASRLASFASASGTLTQPKAIEGGEMAFTMLRIDSPADLQHQQLTTKSDTQEGGEGFETVSDRKGKPLREDDEATSAKPELLAIPIMLYNISIFYLFLAQHAHSTSATVKREDRDAFQLLFRRRLHHHAGARLLRFTKTTLFHIFDTDDQAAKEDPFYLSQLLTLTKMVLEAELLADQCEQILKGRTNKPWQRNHEDLQSCVLALARLRQTVKRLLRDSGWTQFSSLATRISAPAA